MVTPFKNLCDARIVPAESREQFLALEHPGGHVLREHQISLAGISDLSPGYTIGRVDPWYHVLLYTCSGRARIVTEESESWLPPGKLVVLPAHTACGYEVTQGTWRILWFHLSLRKAWSKLEGRAWEIRDHHEGHALLAAVEGFLRETGSSDELSSRAAELYAETIALLLQRDVSLSADMLSRRLDERLWRLWRRVDSQLAHPWTVAELARLAHMSSGHFHRILASRYQTTPVAKLTQLRMARAEALLRNTDERIAAIGTQVGYEDPYAFSTAFRRTRGVSPRAFRSLHRQD